MSAEPISIRPYQLDDIPRLFEAARESVATVGRWLPWCHAGYSMEEARAWVEQKVAAFQAGTEYNFSIVSADGRFLGGCSVNWMDSVNRRANFGYWVRSSAAGRGVTTAAARLLADWTFRHTDLLRLEILAAQGNVASQRVAEKLGALREGVLRRRLLVHGEAHDAVIFSFLRAEWTARCCGLPP